jgi:hypothetical protein
MYLHINGEQAMNISKDFIQHLRNHLEEYNFKLILSNSKQVNTGTGFRCSGFFDEFTRTIRVATKSSVWLEVLVHEYCHFLDYLECSRRELDKENNAIGICESHMKGHICHARSVKYAFLTVARMEWKAEKRAQGIIREWHLPIDLVDYNKEANLHICLYHMYQKHHRYGARNNPATETILAMMPKTISNRMWRGISENLEKALSKYF